MTNSTTLYEQAKREKARRILQQFPEIYAEKFIGSLWTEKQIEIAQALVKYKRVFVKASHSVGKSKIAADLINWRFDCFNPSITLSTAPTKQQVEDIVFKEVRVGRKGRPGLMPKAPRLESAPNHFAAGITAAKPDAFQGRHEESILIVFDEAVGIDSAFWDAAEGMMTGEDCLWLAIMNPTDTASRAYQEEQSGAWHVITASALDHPNIALELAGQPPMIPAAVRLEWVQSRIVEWCTPIDKPEPTDFEFPPGSGIWYRPGPLFESRVLGRWPSSATNAVWSESLWEACLRVQPIMDEPTEIGVDVARYGDDFTSIVVRRGRVVLHHETHNGWGTNETIDRLRELCREFATVGEDPKSIAIKADDDGVGGAIFDNMRDYNVVRVSAARVAVCPDDYPNARSELWFNSAQLAREGMIDASRLERRSRDLIRNQLLAPTWKPDASGRRVVEDKELTKKRIKRSPDDADAFNLAFYRADNTISAGFL